MFRRSISFASTALVLASNALAASTTALFPESFAGHEVPGSVQDGEAPPLWSPLQSVVATEHIDDATNVFAVWQGAVERGSLRMRADPACYTLSSPDRAAWLAIWSRPQAEVFVAAQTTR